jgi:hypothetical protein
MRKLSADAGTLARKTDRGEHLTVRAMANGDRIGIDFRFERNFPAVAIFLNFHRTLAYQLNPYALNLIGGKALTSAIVELGAARRFVVCDGLGMLQSATIFEIRDDTSRAKSMAARGVGQSSGRCSPLDHVEHVEA